MTKQLKLSEIVTDAGTQVRSGLNEATVKEYAEALAAGAKFPPVTVFHDGAHYIAADGFHRIRAAGMTSATEIECDIREGNKTDALRFALGCNAHHGLRLTNADKRHAVEMALNEFATLSDRALADLCKVSDPFVGDIRRQLTANGSQLPPQTRIGRDGVKRRLPPPPMKRRVSALASANEEAPAIKSLLPPLSQDVDRIGWPIPTHLIPLWERRGEVMGMLLTLSEVKDVLRTAQKNEDKLFAEVNFSSALSQLDKASTDIKTAKPFAVCPACQGQGPEQCTMCKGRGFVSKDRWDTCFTEEEKELRIKARQSAAAEGE